MIQVNTKSEMELSPSEIEEARDWIKDCIGSWRDIESEEDVDDLSDQEVIAGIKKHFSGGIEAFKQTVN